MLKVVFRKGCFKKTGTYKSYILHKQCVSTRGTIFAAVNGRFNMVSWKKIKHFVQGGPVKFTKGLKTIILSCINN